MDVQFQYKRGQGVVYVMCHYGTAVWGRGLHQELWYVVDGNVINYALHGVNLTLSENYPVHPRASLKAARMHTHKTARAYAHNSVQPLSNFADQ